MEMLQFFGFGKSLWRRKDRPWSPEAPKTVCAARIFRIRRDKKAAERERRADFSAIVRAFNIVYNAQK